MSEVSVSTGKTALDGEVEQDGQVGGEAAGGEVD